MRVLLTNDDGIAASGLQALRRALLEVPGIELVVIAPDGNRSAAARAITTRRPLKVERIEFEDGTHGFATDGTPVDCVRLARHGLVDGFSVDLVVSGINHGSNLGDDVTYSGTVAAVLEAIVLGGSGIAVSQASAGGVYDYVSHGGDEPFRPVAKFVAGLVADWDSIPMRPATLLNVNSPAQEPKGVVVAKLGKRVYREELVDLGPADGGGRSIRIYGQEPSHHKEDGTDLDVVDDGYIAVTPLHFDLTDHSGIDDLAAAGLGERISPLEQV